MNIPQKISEHFEYALKVDRNRPSFMEKPIIQTEDVKSQLKKLKSRKAPGPDSLKPELYKYITESMTIVNTLTEILNSIVHSGWALHNARKME